MVTVDGEEVAIEAGQNFLIHANQRYSIKKYPLKIKFNSLASIRRHTTNVQAKKPKQKEKEESKEELALTLFDLGDWKMEGGIGFQAMYREVKLNNSY